MGKLKNNKETLFNTFKCKHIKKQICRHNLTTLLIITDHEFPNINIMTLIKYIPYKRIIVNVWENLQMYIHKGNNKLISE